MYLACVLTLVAGLAQKPAPAMETQKLDALRIQVMLDRAGFSPGVIDGRMGANTRRALALFEKQGNQPATPSVEPLSRYRITAEDAAGPFVDRVPEDMVEKAKLPALGYTSLLEALAERFHAAPALLQQLNPGIAFAADQEIQVPNVEPMVIPAPPTAKEPGQKAPASGQPAPSAKPDVVVTVAKGTSTLTVTDSAGRVVLYAPVTTGSEHDPLPIGEWKVNGVQLNPPFHYNPDLFWDAEPGHSKTTIAPGPNNPVGLVWIDISKKHYGIHGTPEPGTVGRTQSHGCVRLTNWDALKLAGMVKPGTRVVFTE
jgi:lipoprotein-anchoring transpeptidase ErfK/SrfK